MGEMEIQILVAIIGASAALIAAIITGRFTLQAARETIRIESESGHATQATDRNGVKIHWVKLLSTSFLLGVLFIPLTFAFAYFGNLWSGVPSWRLLGDSTDPTIVAPIIGALSFILGVLLGHTSDSQRKAMVLTPVFMLLAAPVAFALAYVGNALSGVEKEILAADSLDSGILGSIFCAVGFLCGAMWYRSFQKGGINVAS